MLHMAPTTVEPILSGNDSANTMRRSAQVMKNDASAPPEARRNHLPNERVSTTHKFSVGGHEGYLTVGLYPDGQPGEIFVTMAKEGSTVSGLIGSCAQAISIGLQYGVPLNVFCQKFSFTRFEPSGWTGNPEIPQASSVIDYIFRWLLKKFYSDETITGCLPGLSLSLPSAPVELPPNPRPSAEAEQLSDAPSCKTCGALMRRNGSCYACASCGWTSGCG